MLCRWSWRPPCRTGGYDHRPSHALSHGGSRHSCAHTVPAFPPQMSPKPTLVWGARAMVGAPRDREGPRNRPHRRLHAHKLGQARHPGPAGGRNAPAADGTRTGDSQVSHTLGGRFPKAVLHTCSAGQNPTAHASNPTSDLPSSFPLISPRGRFKTHAM